MQERLTMEQAATLATSGLTALQALRDVAKVQPGQTVLITGASGCVGSFAVQTGARAWSRLRPLVSEDARRCPVEHVPHRGAACDRRRVSTYAGCLGVVAGATWRCRSRPTWGTRRRGPARGPPARLPGASRGRCPGRPIRRWLRCLVRGRRRRGRDRARRWCRAGGDEAVGEHAFVLLVDGFGAARRVVGIGPRAVGEPGPRLVGGGEHADVDGVDAVEEGAMPPLGPVPGSGRHARSDPLAACIP